MYADKTFFEYNPKIYSVFLHNFLHIITGLHAFVKGNVWKNAAAVAAAFMLLSLAEGLAVSALIHSRIGLVGTHQNLVQSAVVLALAMVCALVNGALDALVGIAVHGHFLLLIWFGNSMTRSCKINHGKHFLTIAFMTAP